jgi:hypothetical protein
VTAHARLLEAGDEIRTTSLVVAGEDGVPCLVVDRLHFKRAPRAAVLSDPVDGWLHEIAWKPAAAPPPAELAGRWLVAGDGPTGAALSAVLAARGAQLVHAIDGDLRGVIYLGGLEVAPTEALTAERLAGAGDACAGALRLVQELEERGATSRLFIVTRGAQAVTGAPDRLTLAAAPLLGFARVVRREQPGLTCTSVDLDPAAAPDDVRGLLAELTGREDEVAWRGGDRFVPRLRRLAPAPRPALEIPPGEQGFVVEPAERTGPNGIRVRPATPRPPGPGEVLIRVRATGVNFKDVLSSLGRFELPLGIECAGTVAAVGAGGRRSAPRRRGHRHRARERRPSRDRPARPRRARARATFRSRRRPACPSPSSPRATASRTWPGCRRASACSSTRSPAASGWRRCSSRARPAPRSSPWPARRSGRSAPRSASSTC